MKTPILLLIAGLAFTVPMTLAQTEETPKPEVKAEDLDPVSDADRDFLVEAAQGNAAEVKLADLALEKAGSAEVREYATMLKKGHLEAQKELETLTTALGVTVPETPSEEQQALYDRLEKLSGGEFDKAYLDAMKEDHQKDVREYEKAAEDADSPVIKGFATRILPTLQTHLQKAESIGG